jgi:hypothetical protein
VDDSSVLICHDFVLINVIVLRNDFGYCIAGSRTDEIAQPKSFSFLSVLNFSAVFPVARVGMGLDRMHFSCTKNAVY